VERPGKVLIVGLNYASHAEEARKLFAEMGRPDIVFPTEPNMMILAASAVTGPHSPITLPATAPTEVDYEGELAVVIGRLARNVRAEDAFRFILGYTCGNDVTLRDLQKKDGQWSRAKGFDGSCPLGPWIETSLDPNEVGLQTRVNGQIRQSATTADMVFGVATILEFLTQFMTLLPGDVIMTGTPEGVGKLEPGDVVEVEVDGIGVLRNPVAS